MHGAGRLAGLRIVPCRDIRAALQAVLGISIGEREVTSAAAEEDGAEPLPSEEEERVARSDGV